VDCCSLTGISFFRCFCCSRWQWENIRREQFYSGVADSFVAAAGRPAAVVLRALDTGIGSACVGVLAGVSRMNRRGFMSSILALGAAPAIVRAESLMRIVLPTFEETLAINYYERKIVQDIFEISRKAFVPGLITQIYKTTPLSVALMELARSSPE
jgi:hypothetical protein